MMSKKSFVGVVLMAGALSSAISCAHSANDIDSTPTAIRYLERNGGVVKEHFVAPGKLDGWVVEKAQANRVFYTTKEGVLISGAIYDGNGVNLSAPDVFRTQPGQPGGAHPEGWKQAETSRFISEGNGKKIVYFVIDPTCPYCKKLWTDTRRFAGKKDFQLRWILVSVLSEQGAPLAEAAIKANSVTALNEVMTGKVVAHGAVKKETTTILEANKKMQAVTHTQGVPLMLYKDAGGVSRATYGLPAPATLDAIFKD